MVLARRFLRDPYVICLLIILGLAAFLRLHNLAYGIPSLNQDEVVNGYDAYSIGHTLRDHHGILLPRTLGSFGDSASVALTYLTIPFMLIGGLTETALRLPIAISGILSVLISYLLVLEVTKNRRLSLIAATLFAISPWNITLTRWAIPPSIVPFLLLLFLWLFALAIKRESHRTLLLIMAGAAGGLLTYSYPSSEIIAPVLILAAGLIFLYRRYRQMLTLFISYGLVVVPLYFSILFQPSSNFARYGAVKLPGTGLQLLKEIVVRYKDYFSYNFYFGATGADPSNHVPGVGNFYWFFAAFIVIGLAALVWFLAKNRKNLFSLKWLENNTNVKVGIFLLVWALVGPVPPSVTIDREHVLRAIFMFPLVLFLIALAFEKTLNSLKTSYVKYTIVLLVILLSVFQLKDYYTTYYSKKYDLEIASTFQPGVKQGMEYILAHQSSYKKVIIDRNINQPYIYYLFFSKYNPQKIDYAEININFANHKGYFVPKIGKYYFTLLSARDVDGAKLLSSVKLLGKVWYKIYARGNQEIIMKKVEG